MTLARTRVLYPFTSLISAQITDVDFAARFGFKRDGKFLKLIRRRVGVPVLILYR